MKIEKPKNINTSHYTDEENKLLDWAIENICEKYLNAGGDPNKMMSWEQIDCFFCGLLYREGEQAVKDFVNGYNYTPPIKVSRGYA